jgi:esterase/lipase
VKVLKWFGFILLLLIIVYFLGPKPTAATYNTDLPSLPSEPASLDKYIGEQEALYKIKQDNEARIIWADDSLKQATEFAVIYIHGFTASQEEGDPVHYSFAKKFGMNLYLSRLADHGIDTSEPLLNVTAERLWSSAKFAYAVGKALGKKIILMATSTGATLALKLAVEFPDIAGLILMSPNVAINDPNAWLLNNPWGLQIARLIKGKYNHARDTTELYARYWYPKYRMESVVQLEELLESTMKESTFQKVKQPTLVLYYYKDEENQDKVVKVTAIKRMFAQLGTPSHLKKQVAIPGAGDHVIGSYIKSKDVQGVSSEIERFATDILQLKQPRSDAD